MRSALYKICILCGLLALPPRMAAQPVPEDFRRIAESLIKRAPKTYQEFSNALLPYQKDTVLMLHFARQSQIRDFPEGLSYAYNQLGAQLQYISDFDRAITQHKKALDAATQARNPELQIVSLNMLGMAHRKTESIKTSLDHYREALNLAETISQPTDAVQAGINEALNGIGNIYRLLEQYDLAIKYFEESLQYDIKLENLLGQAMNYQNIAECLEAQGKLEPAMSYYEKSLEINRALGSRKIEIVSKYGMAHVLAHQDKAGQARDLLESILSDAEALGDQEIRSSIYLQFGWILTKLGSYSEAKGYLFKGLAIAENIPLYSNIYQANAWLHDIYKIEGDYQRALLHYENAQSMRRQVSNERNRQYVYEIISNAESEKRLDQIEELARDNELINMKLRRNRTALLVGALLLLLFTLILYILYRQYQLNSEKKVLTLEQNMLRSQMNPHFLFNSLNSIKLYIINNEQKNAVHYLNKFSKLVRKILEASSLKEIPLQEELETVELYMNIENIRFNNEIDFSIEVDPEINTSLVKIPSLILQPFLENALWHGLSSKEGEKIIRIEVRQAERGFIHITISDNGIGRTAAERIKESRVLKRKSVGIAITKERLANFSKDYQNTYDVSMEDLVRHDGNPAGTQVTIRIPTV